MQDLNDKITGNTLTATEWNEVPSEIQNVIEALGQTLSSGDLNQLGKSIAGYIANANFYTDTGIADAYVLTKIGSKQAATAYTDGFTASFIAGNTNTGASTVNIAGLGIKNIIGSEVAGSVLAGKPIIIRYRLSSDNFTLTPIDSRSVLYDQAGTGAVERDVATKLKEHVSVGDFDADETGVQDSTTEMLNAANGSSRVELSEGTYLVDQIPNVGSTDYIGLGTVDINIDAGSAISNSLMVKLMSDSKYIDINFTSLITTQDSQRGAIDDSADIFVQRCSFNDFIDTGVGNAWGTLIQRSSRITLDQCSYSNNTQADIALTDDCFDINIFNPKNTTDSGVYLNVEPNTGIGVRGMNVIGGHYRQIDLLENDNTVYSSQNIVVQGARIDVLRYDGSGAVFQNCQIASIIPEPAGLTNIFAGQLMIDTCSLRQNLLVDEHVFDVSPSDANSYWTVTNTGTVAQKRVNDSVHGKYTQINPDNEAQGVIISTRTDLAVTAGENLMVFMRGRMNNTGTGTNQVENIILQWFDAGLSLIQNTIVKVNRGPVNVQGGWTNDIAIVQAPALATTVKFRITNSFSSTYVGELDIASVGLFRFDLDQEAQGLGDMPEVIGTLSKPVTQKDYIRSDTFLGTNQGYGGMFVGERIIRETPVVASPKAWSCTVVPASVGLAGTIVSEGNL